MAMKFDFVGESKHSCQDIYDVIADIMSYPKILPYVQSVLIREQSKDRILASVTVKRTPINLSYDCEILLDPAERSIKVYSDSGPFRKLFVQWKFESIAGKTRVTHSMECTLKSRAMEFVAKSLLKSEFHSTFDAFERQLQSRTNPM